MPLQNQENSTTTLETFSDGLLLTSSTKQWSQSQFNINPFEDLTRNEISKRLEGAALPSTNSDGTREQPFTYFSTEKEFLAFNSGKLNYTSTNSLPISQEKLTKAFLSSFYHERYPIIISELKDRLEIIRLREDDWDNKSSLKPNQQSLSRAHILLESFIKNVIDNGYVWKAPLISSDEDGFITIEWHKGDYELHIEVTENAEEYIKVWGTNIEHEMHVGVLNKNKYLLLWDWLLHG